jgi:hypothetical protein
MIRKLRASRIVRAVAADSGVAGVLLVSVIAIVAFTALSVFLNKYIGDRAFERARGTSAGQGLVLGAVMAYYYQQDPTHTLPCPDTSATPDGVADSCQVSGTTTGVLPWQTLGLSRDMAVDTYGNFFTYVVSTVGRNVCTTITGDLTGATNTTTYTGSLIEATDLTLTEISGATRNVAFAIISHGLNGLGATGITGAVKGSPTGSNEVANAAAQPSTIYAGPFSTDEDTYFDDQVFAPSNAELQKACESLTPGGKLNADMSDNFDSAAATLDTTKFGTTGSGSAPTVVTDTRSANNKVVSFTNNTSYLYTADAFNFNPVVRSVYVSALWTPNPTSAGGVTAAGFSLATRATLADLTASSDLFTAGTSSGITFRFDNRSANNISGGSGTANTISIRDGGTELAASVATYRLITAETYRLELYDNGSDLWMRITQVDDPTNSVTLRTTSTADLASTQNRIFAINGPAASFLDDFVTGLPMLALETGVTNGAATNGITATAAAANGTATGNLTLEAWIRPKVLPTGTNHAVIISQWDTNVAALDSDQSFRLYLDSENNDQLALDIGGTISGAADTETFNLGFKPDVDEWAHVAVTFDSSSKIVSLYINGVLATTTRSSTDTGTGVRAAVERFSVGASLSGGSTITDPFNGDISDVRVWSTVRTADNISDFFQARLAAAGTVTGLVVNWKLDRESGGFGSAVASASPSTIGTSGALSGSATYVPTLALYFRPFSTTFCPVGTRVGPYQCDFRTSSASGASSNFAVPSNLTGIFAKVWGAGGGGYDPGGTTDDTTAGAGGFSAGFVQSINATAISGQLIDVYVGGFGAGSSSTNTAGGGGGGSGIYLTAGNHAGLVAGGGGGASYSSDGSMAGGGDCSATTGANRCGLGGSGGGAGGSALTTRAPSSTASCGGRGGDNSPTAAGPPPTTGGDCDNGGAGPTGRQGGGLVVGGGGGPSFIAGGSPYTGSSAQRIGGGGGGGGAIGAEAGGYDDANNSRGYGGGGGSGTADGAGVVSVSGEAGSYTTSFSDATRTGDKTNNSPIITNISPNLSTTNWQVGYSISGAGIPAGTTILSIDSNTQITMSQDATNGTDGVTLTVTNTGSTVGGSSDPYYSPSYLGSTIQNPGRAGTTGASGGSTSRDGRGGAVVIIW